MGAPKETILELFCVSLRRKRLKRGFRRTELGSQFLVDRELGFLLNALLDLARYGVRPNVRCPKIPRNGSIFSHAAGRRVREHHRRNITRRFVPLTFCQPLGMSCVDGGEARMALAPVLLNAS